VTQKIGTLLSSVNQRHHSSCQKSSRAGEQERLEPNVDCQSCIAENATLQPDPKRNDRATCPLERVHIDLLTGGVTSLEGYDYAMVVTNDTTMHQWVHGLKTKDDSSAMIRKSVCNISYIRDRHLIKIILRDNSGKLKCKTRNGFIERLGTKNRF
jgi:hypothetical protein